MSGQSVFNVAPEGRWDKEVMNDGATVVLSCKFDDLGLYLRLESRGDVYTVGLYAGSPSGTRLEEPTTHETVEAARERAKQYLTMNPEKYYECYSEQRESLDSLGQ